MFVVMKAEVTPGHFSCSRTCLDRAVSLKGVTMDFVLVGLLARIVQLNFQHHKAE